MTGTGPCGAVGTVLSGEIQIREKPNMQTQKELTKHQ